MTWKDVRHLKVGMKLPLSCDTSKQDKFTPSIYTASGRDLNRWSQKTILRNKERERERERERKREEKIKGVCFSL